MINITWEDYHTMVKDLHVKIQQKIPTDEKGKIHLFGVARGGLLVATHLSYMSTAYRLYGLAESFQKCSKDSSIVIDDVLETGKTRIDVSSCLDEVREYPFAVLFDKSFLYDIPPADVSIMRLESKIWIQLPWERDEGVDENEKQCMKERGYETS